MVCKLSLIKDRLLGGFCKILNELKYYLIIFTIFFIIAFVTGILSASKYSQDITAENLINETLLEFLKKEKGVFSLFFSYYFWFFTLSLFIILFTKNLFINILEVIALMLLAYIIGFDLCVIFFSFGLVGIIFSIFIYGILMLFVCMTLIFILSFATKLLKNKVNCLVSRDKRGLKSVYLTFLILQFVILYVLCILLSILHIFVIID